MSSMTAARRRGSARIQLVRNDQGLEVIVALSAQADKSLDEGMQAATLRPDHRGEKRPLERRVVPWANGRAFGAGRAEPDELPNDRGWIGAPRAVNQQAGQRQSRSEERVLKLVAFRHHVVAVD